MEQEMKRNWANVTISEDMPLHLIIDFLNVLNSRLSAVESLIRVPHPEKKDETMTLSELYEYINVLKSKEQEGE